MAAAPTRLNILIATAHRQIVGGIEQYLRSIMPELLQRGHRLGLLYERAGLSGAPTIDTAVTGLERWEAGEHGTSIERLAGWSPDVVYSQGLDNPALEAALVGRFPTVLFAHGYFGTCATGTKRHAFPRLAMCGRTLGAACLPLNYARRCGGLSPVSLARAYRRESARRALLGSYRAVIAASRHMTDEMARHGVRPDRLHHLALPCVPLVPDIDQPVGRPMSGMVLMLGRLTTLKGGDVLIDAIPAAEKALGRRLALTVAGTGPELPNWRARASANGVAARFPGWVDEAGRLDLLRAADLLVVPSLWPEPFGLVGIEAGCVGLPAAAFRAGGIPEWLSPGESGELAPADPPTAVGLAEAIVRALRDPAHHTRLRIGAWKVAKRFGMAPHLDGLEAVLRSACRAAPVA